MDRHKKTRLSRVLWEWLDQASSHRKTEAMARLNEAGVVLPG
jgi:hypothetical protein